MTVWIKQGVIGDLQSIARKGLGHVAKLYGSAGHDLYITSLREGNHSAGSFHYDGLAFDIKPGKINIKEIRKVLGPDWDVVDETNHFHCEYDPK